MSESSDLAKALTEIAAEAAMDRSVQSPMPILEVNAHETETEKLTSKATLINVDLIDPEPEYKPEMTDPRFVRVGETFYYSYLKKNTLPKMAYFNANSRDYTGEGRILVDDFGHISSLGKEYVDIFDISGGSVAIKGDPISQRDISLKLLKSEYKDSNTK